ncbi:MAG: alpha/beta hydrolase [Pseudomonadota bacterium]
MRIHVNGVDLWFDVDGAKLSADGAEMREKPTLVLLHGGPGADHSIYKPCFDRLTELAQIVYVDLRGNGRSEDGDPENWVLAQWGDDVHAFCAALGIEKPIVLGASWGGVVAQAYATRHPDHPGALILAATAARTEFEAIFAAFEALGGPHPAAVARAYWSDPSPERRAAYFETCLPLYSQSQPDTDRLARMIIKNPVAMAYNGQANEQGLFDFRADLAALTCPVLVISADQDPIMPSVFSDVIEAHLTAAPVTRRRLSPCGHAMAQDQPTAFFGAIESFIREVINHE